MAHFFKKKHFDARSDFKMSCPSLTPYCCSLIPLNRGLDITQAQLGNAVSIIGHIFLCKMQKVQLFLLLWRYLSLAS